MGYYALLAGNIVSEVIAGRDEDDLVEGVSSWEDYYCKVVGQPVKRTSYNTLGGVHYTDGEPSADQAQALRFNYAGIGYTYDETRDAFIPPTPHPSWVLDESTCQWVAPTPKPDGDYVWDERAGDWVEA
jgi:hypothetical protein